MLKILLVYINFFKFKLTNVPLFFIRVYII